MRSSSILPHRGFAFEDNLFCRRISMQLSARPLIDVSGVNSFTITDQIKFSEGDATTIYFQLIDASLDTVGKGFNPAGRRYMPVSGATLSVDVDNIDDAKKITRSATQPYTLDPSIWAVTILSTDDIGAGTISIKLTLTQSGVVTRGVAMGIIGVISLTGNCNGTVY